MINGMAKSIPFFKAVIARVFTNFIIGGKTLLFMKPFINKPPLRCEDEHLEIMKIRKILEKRSFWTILSIFTNFCESELS